MKMLNNGDSIIREPYEDELNFQYILCDEINEDDLINYEF